jgi:uncharacterized membrane protein YfcA
MAALAALTVLLVAAVFAALGQGGALLYTPMFHWYGYGLKSIVIPLALLLNGLTTLLALIPYGRKRLVDWVGGLPMVAAALVFAPLGALVAPHVPTRVLLVLFAGAVLLAALRTLLTATRPEPRGLVPVGRRMAIGSLVAAAAGFAAGMLGIGGGFIIAPLLMWLGYETKRAAATTAYVVTFSSFSGFAGHLGHMAIDWPLLLAAVPAVVVGSLAGSWFMANRARPSAVRWLYGLLLIGVAVKLLV